MRVLLVEPDHVLAGTYLKALEAEGHDTRVVSGAQSAITAADAQKPDVVVLELQLVSHSGIEFLYEFRSYNDWQQIPVIIHSNVPPSEFTDNWQLLKDELGVHVYHYKPLTSLQMLLSSVSDLAALNA